MSSDLKWLKENIGITDVKATIANLESQRDDDKIKIDTNKQIIDDCTDNIKRSGLQQSEDVIQSYAKKYADIDSKIKAELNGINRQQEELRKQETTKEGLSKQLDKMSSSDSEFEKVKNQYKICEGLYNIFKESKEAYREELKKNVELDASSFFVQLSEDPDYTGLKINQNYGLEIIHKSGSIVPGRSSGYEHLVALSLIGALHKNAPLRGPIIIDSPFGRLDPQNKKNMIRTLPSMADQVILLAYTDEIDNQTARKELGNNLLAEYSLKRISSMHTEIEKS
jgi:DNA sulfur modification protein DndD